ncbi:DUF4124 domain-containing protein [Marinobacter zhanjiangensis]|uniref:DUF4124 domain-containing protein n=1 Tax=Marinobacter zhanjiangensis TaxID=578215 RepID=A0ABQ3B5W2_9GAMM|nr:DUF4124 domain-containing protein [Marinobacter zhanjiangensis]GGY79635.1 hypothetical protein GCM10007071_28940 [Marinobacter zhanjiangensis]
MIQRLILLALIAMTAPALASAQSVYRWQDENGVVHFGDREPVGQSSERVSVKTGKSSGDADRPSAQEQVQALDESQAERERREKETAVEEARRKQREARCQAAQANLQAINSNARIRVTEDGEQRYLSPEEIAEKKQQFENIVEESCGEPAS